MHREGHVGVALAAYAPIGFAASLAGFRELAFLGAGLAAALSTLPDVDAKLPLVTHRGYTHTVWFALLVGAACGVAASNVELVDEPAVAGGLAVFGAVVAATSVLSHVAADAMTPMGVRPFAPFGGRYSLGLVRAANRLANLALLATGVVVLVAAFWLATTAR